MYYLYVLINIWYCIWKIKKVVLVYCELADCNGAIVTARYTRNDMSPNQLFGQIVNRCLQYLSDCIGLNKVEHRASSRNREATASNHIEFRTKSSKETKDVVKLFWLFFLFNSIWTQKKLSLRDLDCSHQVIEFFSAEHWSEKCMPQEYFLRIFL